jgi:hypothetical protein
LFFSALYPRPIGRGFTAHFAKNEKIVLPTISIALLSFSTFSFADSTERSMLAQKYLGPIGEKETSHNYNQVSIGLINERISHHNASSNDEDGHEIRATKTLGKYTYGIAGFSNIDGSNIESVKAYLGLGFNADLGFNATNTDLYGEALVLHYDTEDKVNSFTNSDDGITSEFRVGLRSDWGIPNVDSRLYVGLSDSKAYTADSDGGMDGVIGASLGYNIIPQLTVSVGIERIDGPEYSIGDSGLSIDESVKKYATLSYNF